MKTMTIDTPIAILPFRRVETTRRIFDVIRSVRPKTLLIAADGARNNNPDEARLCELTRAIFDQVDWDCEVIKFFPNHNMGTSIGISRRIDWIFEQVEEAIILEDDCLPDPSFFYFCDELLKKYRNDMRVMTIAGFNILGEWKSNEQSYHFSTKFPIWGWATWRRAWNHYDFEMKKMENPSIRKLLENSFQDPLERDYRLSGYNKVFSGEIKDTWDLQWDFSMYLNTGLTIVPSVNLISNLGILLEDAQHPSLNDPINISKLPLLKIKFPLEHPPALVADREFDYLRNLKQKGSSRKKYLLKNILKEAKTLWASNAKSKLLRK
jgi:hypothetical protein